jgi:hypothetical protein
MDRRCSVTCFAFAIFMFTLSAEARVESYDPRVSGKEPAEYAWWVAIEFKPAGSEIEGIPVKQIRPNWVLASVLTKDSIPAQVIEEDEGRDSVAEAKLVFACDGDFNADGVPDRALVGVYEDTQGGLGKFLLIVTRSGSDKWKVLLVDAVPEKPGFSALRLQGKGLEWWLCMQCDDFYKVFWDRKKGRFQLKYGGP